ncbi:MAG: hypothetical protein DWQ42_13010 [Planctomycetota bacterium]|nr:MAG: hypothetical protein DWQ42_13010 [Planctomycetota bacterium]REK40145.1 MAG: hypothetical protein DWQ46_16935 [Planctomycetota bacterium]
MSESPQNSDPNGSPRRSRVRFQFTLRTMFLIMALACVLFLALGGLVRHSGSGIEDRSKGQFVLITLIAPVGMVLLLALVRGIFRGSGKRRRDRW